MGSPPDDKRLEVMIAEAFDRLPGPAAPRMEAIEARLLRQLPAAATKERRHPRFYWWLITGLIATGAAAWWAGNYYWGKGNDAVETRQGGSDAPGMSRPSRPADTQAGRQLPERNRDNDARDGKDTQPPVIYRREVY